MAYVTTLAAVAVRVLLLYIFISRNSLWVCLLALTEALALISTVRGLMKEKIDKTQWGALVPALYMVCLLLKAEGKPNLYPWLFFILMGIGQSAWRCYMGWHLTVGTPMMRTILTQGPYGLVRHPGASMEIMMVAGLIAAYPTFYNLVVGLISLGAAISVVLIEERYLMKFPNYQKYTVKVRKRFIPGLI